MFIKTLVLKTIRALGYDLVRWREGLDHKFSAVKNLGIRHIVDVGANRGQFALSALEYFPGARVYSFEPLPDAFAGLSAAAAAEPRLKAFNLAVGDAEGEAEMLLHLDKDDASSFLKATPEYEARFGSSLNQKKVKVKTVMLDGIASTLLKDLDGGILVKMDVQGFEDRVVKGGAAFLRRARACILEISLDRLYDGQAEFGGLVSLMAGAGFKYAGNLEQVKADDGHVIYLDALFINGSARD